jgi:hypothetical protein
MNPSFKSSYVRLIAAHTLVEVSTQPAGMASDGPLNVIVKQVSRTTVVLPSEYWIGTGHSAETLPARAERANTTVVGCIFCVSVGGPSRAGNVPFKYQRLINLVFMAVWNVRRIPRSDRRIWRSSATGRRPIRLGRPMALAAKRPAWPPGEEALGVAGPLISRGAFDDLIHASRHRLGGRALVVLLHLPLGLALIGPVCECVVLRPSGRG